MQFITGPARLQMQVTRNYESIMDHKKQRIEETSQPIKLFYAERFKNFNSED